MGSKAEIIAGLITYIISTILLSYFLITVLTAIFCNKTRKTVIKTKIKSAFTWSSTICILLFWLRSILATIYFLIITPSPHHIDRFSKLLNIGWICYGLGIWIMLFAFVLRIDYTFKGQYSLQYSPIMINILYIMLIILLILIVSTGIVNTMGQYIAVYIGYAVLLFHFIFSCLLSYLLFNKLFIMMRSRLNKNDEIQTNESKEDVIKLNDIESMTRFALLMFIGIISTYIASILIFLDVAYLWSTHENLLTLSAIFLAIDMMINSNSVYLLFTFNNKKYFLVCNGAHGFCQKCCIQCIYQTQKNKTKQECQNLILAQDDNENNNDDALL